MIIKINKNLFILLLLAIQSNAWSQLQPLPETELDKSIGQAIFTADSFSDAGQALSFTRLNFGADIDIQLNADSLVVGKYARADETLDADISLENFALGHIENGEIVPFKIRDPFIEFAFDESTANNDLAGIRLGFGDVTGTLSLDIKSLTGNINAIIKGKYTAFRIVPTDASAEAELIALNNGVDTRDGSHRDAIRADWIGVPDGEQFHADIIGTIPVDLTVRDCDVNLVGEGVCFPLSNFKSLELGSKNDDGSLDFAPGMFLSLQMKDMTWGNNTAEDPFINTTKGAFFNIPNGLLILTPGEALGGRPRVQTEFINRGIGRF